MGELVSRMMTTCDYLNFGIPNFIFTRSCSPPAPGWGARSFPRRPFSDWCPRSPTVPPSLDVVRRQCELTVQRGRVDAKNMLLRPHFAQSDRTAPPPRPSEPSPPVCPCRRGSVLQQAPKPGVAVEEEAQLWRLGKKGLHPWRHRSSCICSAGCRLPSPTSNLRFA